MNFDDIDIKKIPAEEFNVYAGMVNHELSKLAAECPPEADAAAKDSLIAGAKARARAKFAEYMEPRLQAQAAERERKVREAWLNWERLDDARTAAFQRLEDGLVAAYTAAAAAWEAYPADRGILPKRYGTSPETIEGCADLAAKQGETTRLLRDKAGAS